MRSFLALVAVVLGLVLASGCDATDIPATRSTQLPYPTEASGSGSAAPPAESSSSRTRSTKPSRSATTKPSAAHTGRPSVTAAATDTANAGSGSTSGVPTSYAAGAARIAALHGARHLRLNRFSTTGDVVYCVLRSSMIPVSCELRRGAIRDPGVCGRSMADAVGRIQLGDEGAVPECNSDTIREPGARTVAAPAVVTDGRLSCAVERIGVTCVNSRTEAGFFLTPGKYATFSR